MAESKVQYSFLHSSNPKLSKAENESFINTSFTNLRSMKSWDNLFFLRKSPSFKKILEKLTNIDPSRDVLVPGDAQILSGSFKSISDGEGHTTSHQHGRFSSCFGSQGTLHSVGLTQSGSHITRDIIAAGRFVLPCIIGQKLTRFRAMFDLFLEPPSDGENETTLDLT